METWYSEKGFVREPFYSEPVGTKTIEIMRGFINRVEEKEELKKFIEQKSGRVIIVSTIGVGKSSFCNLAEYNANNLSKLVIRLDPTKISNKVEECIKSILVRLNYIKNENLDEGKKELFSKYLSSLNLLKADGIKKNLIIIINRLERLFEEIPCVIIMDDLDKRKDFELFIKKVVDFLPKNMLLIATGELNEIRQSTKTINTLYEVFDFPILLRETNDIKGLKEFVEGRIKRYSKGKPLISFSDEILKVILDKTKGNLREAFRYLNELSKEKEYSKENLIKIIKRVDIMKITDLDSTDVKLLNLLAGKEMTLLELQKEKLPIKIHAIKKRLDELNQSGLVFRRTKGSRKLFYSSPSIMRDILENHNPLV